MSPCSCRGRAMSSRTASGTFRYCRARSAPPPAISARLS
jgi:hypothetical protein